MGKNKRNNFNLKRKRRKIMTEEKHVEPKTSTTPKKRDRSRIKSVIITGPSITVNKKIYGASAMATTYTTSTKLPDKEKVQEICAEAYMKLLRLFTFSEDTNE
jgi:hypothetical protein